MQVSKPFAGHAPTQSPFFAFPWARRGVLALWLGATAAVVGMGIVGFHIDNSVGVWFETDDPALAEYRRFLADFGHREWMLVALEYRPSEQGSWAADRDALAATLRQMPHVHRALASRDFPEGSEFVKAFLQPNPRRPYEALLLQVTNDIETQDGYREALINDIRRVAAALPAVASVHVAGTAVINGELNRAARRDMILFFPLVALFIAALGAAMFRNARDTAVLLCVSLGTVVATQGLLIGAGHPLNMITVMLPTVLIALSVADVVHLVHAFHAARAAAGDSASSAARAVRSVAWPCAGTSLTTIAGFLAFAGSSVLPVFQLAVFGAIGIAMAWVLTVTVAPVLLTILWREARPAEWPAGLGERALGAWWRLLQRSRRPIVAAFAIAGIPLTGLALLRADTDYVQFFRSGTRVPRDYAVLQREGFPQNPLNLVLRAPEGTSPLAPDYLVPLRRFADELEVLPGVQAVLSPFLMADAPAALGDQAGTLGGMLSRQGDQVQLVVMMDHPSSQELFELLPEIRALAARVLPAGMELTPTGTSLLWAHMDDGVIETQKQSLLVVSIVCFGILALLFRSAWLAALGLAVSLYPVAMVLGLMGWWGIPVNLATVLIAGIAVGLAVDDTIHLVHAFQERRRHGRDRRAACEEALIAVGPRMVMTSCILVGSFAVMGLSDFMPTAQFGLLSSLTIVLALAADAVLLPVLLGWRRTGRPVAQTLDPSPVLPTRTAWGRLL